MRLRLMPDASAAVSMPIIFADFRHAAITLSRCRAML